MKPERTQDNIFPDPHHQPEQPEPRSLAAGWRAMAAPIAITRRYPYPNFSASVGFLQRIASVLDERQDRHCRVAAITLDHYGVTIALGSSADTGVSEAEMELAAALNQAA
ncbi:MAG: 4a-hydroxytetrahydrobiopterin dehydratase [Acidobacteriota bacterium]